MITKILGLFHVHFWTTTKYNIWCISIEEKCRCGQYRHHTWNDVKGFVINWQKGRLPNDN